MCTFNKKPKAVEVFGGLIQVAQIIVAIFEIVACRTTNNII